MNKVQDIVSTVSHNVGFNDEKPAVIPPQMLQQQQQQIIGQDGNGQQLLLPQSAGGNGGQPPQHPQQQQGSNGGQNNVLRRSISGVSTGPMGKKKSIFIIWLGLLLLYNWRTRMLLGTVVSLIEKETILDFWSSVTVLWYSIRIACYNSSRATACKVTYNRWNGCFHSWLLESSEKRHFSII